jgi:hypothetical protein
MFSVKNKLEVECVVARTGETVWDAENRSAVYDAPELHVVGQSNDLVQGCFGYIGRDLSYTYR